MFGDTWGYRALVAGVAIVGVAAVLFSAVGLYVVFTGGTGTSPDVDVLGGYECETSPFEDDPEVPHNASYGIDRTLVSASVVESFNTTRVGDGVRVTLDVDGGVLAASAVRTDGTEVSVRQVDGEDRIVVESNDTDPFRLWIDSVDDETTVTRTRLDVCPPAA